jgi:hypothetical protein
MNLTPGVYEMNVTATDTGTPPESASDRLYLRVVRVLPVLSNQLDSDGDGQLDADEGHGDDDGDGVPNYLDAIAQSHLLQTEVGSGLSRVMEAFPGLQLRLGKLSIDVGVAKLVSGEVAAYLVEIGENPESVTDSVENVSGYYDYEIHGLGMIGESTQVILPLSTPIPQHAAYRQYHPGEGWKDYVIDQFNKIGSAPGVAGACPPPGDSAYVDGLHEGDWCVQLTIQDGGENDNDRGANRTIANLGGVGTSAPPASTATNSSGGSGILYMPFLLLLFSVYWYRSNIYGPR